MEIVVSFATRFYSHCRWAFAMEPNLWTLAQIKGFEIHSHLKFKGSWDSYLLQDIGTEWMKKKKPQSQMFCFHRMGSGVSATSQSRSNETLMGVLFLHSIWCVSLGSALTAFCHFLRDFARHTLKRWKDFIFLCLKEFSCKYGWSLWSLGTAQQHSWANSWVLQNRRRASLISP